MKPLSGLANMWCQDSPDTLCGLAFPDIVVVGLFIARRVPETTDIEAGDAPPSSPPPHRPIAASRRSSPLRTQC